MKDYLTTTVKGLIGGASSGGMIATSMNMDSAKAALGLAFMILTSSLMAISLFLDIRTKAANRRKAESEAHMAERADQRDQVTTDEHHHH